MLCLVASPCPVFCRFLSRTGVLLGRRFGRIFEEESVVVAEDEVINLLFHTLDRVLDEPFSLYSFRQAILLLASCHVVRLLQRIDCLLLSLVFQEASLEGLRRVEVNFLSHQRLLVLKHLLS